MLGAWLTACGAILRGWGRFGCGGNGSLGCAFEGYAFSLGFHALSASCCPEMKELCHTPAAMMLCPNSQSQAVTDPLKLWARKGPSSFTLFSRVFLSMLCKSSWWRCSVSMHSGLGDSSVSKYWSATLVHGSVLDTGGSCTQV